MVTKYPPKHTLTVNVTIENVQRVLSRAMVLSNKEKKKEVYASYGYPCDTHAHGRLKWELFSLSLCTDCKL